MDNINKTLRNEEKIMESFRKNVSSLLAKKSMTQMELADKSTVSYESIKKYLSYKKYQVPGIDNVAQIADALDISLDVLINANIDIDNVPDKKRNVCYELHKLATIIERLQLVVSQVDNKISISSDNKYVKAFLTDLSNNKTKNREISHILKEYKDLCFYDGNIVSTYDKEKLKYKVLFDDQVTEENRLLVEKYYLMKENGKDLDDYPIDEAMEILQYRYDYLSQFDEKGAFNGVDVINLITKEIEISEKPQGDNDNKDEEYLE